MPEPLTAPPRPPRAKAAEAPPPPRAMAHAARRGNRRRSWSRWTGPLVKIGIAVLPVAALAGYWTYAWKAGVVDQALADLNATVVETTVGAGFALDEVMVAGRTETDPAAILDAIGLERGAPLLTLDLAAARERLEALPWVATAAVERRLPDTLYVRLTERRPMAIWQNDRRFVVIDRDGRPLADALELASRGSRIIDTLPHVVGPTAPRHAPELLEALARAPELQGRVAAATRVGDRRWNLKLDNGVVVKLPEAGMAMALRQLAEMQRTGRLIDRDVVAIDMRIPDRMVVQTSDTAANPPADEPKRKPGNRT